MMMYQLLSVSLFTCQLLSAVAQSIINIGPDGSTCLPFVTVFVQAQEVDAYFTAPTATDICGDGTTVAITVVPTMYITTCHSTYSSEPATSLSNTVDTLSTATTPGDGDNGGISSSYSSGSTSTSTEGPNTVSNPSSTSTSLSNGASAYLTPSPTVTYAPVPPPSTTATNATVYETTTDANGNTVTSTIVEPTFTLGQGLPRGTVTAIPQNSPVLLGFAFRGAASKLRRRQSIDSAAVGFASNAGTGDSCSYSPRFYLQDGMLLSDDREVGKNFSDVFAEILPTQAYEDVSTVFFFDNGMLGWNATDFGPATFYQCGGGPLYAGFPYPPYSNCSVALVGGIDASECPADLSAIRNGSSSDASPTTMSTTSATATINGSVPTTSSGTTVATSSASTNSTSMSGVTTSITVTTTSQITSPTLLPFSYTNTTTGTTVNSMTITPMTNSTNTSPTTSSTLNPVLLQPSP